MSAPLPDAGIVVSWEPMVSGRVYAVEHTFDLTTPFTNLQDGIAYPQGDYAESNGVDRAFYRVGVQLQ